MHEVENMFSVGETPWHGLGTILDNPPTSTEAIQAAGLAWNVALEPLAMADGRPVRACAVVRTSDRSILCDHIGPDFTPLQNAEAFAWFDPFVRAGQAKYETAGSLREGRRVWILASLDRDPCVIVKQADDVVRKYMLLSNSHDGSLAVRLGFTPTRVVCANTLAMAHNDAGSALLRIKHTKGVRDTIEAVRDIVDAANARFEATAEQYRALASCDISAEDLDAFVNVVFRSKVTDARKAVNARNAAVKSAKELAARGVLAMGPVGGFVGDEEEADLRALPKVRELFESGKGNALPGVRGTWWAAYNAVTEYLQYEKRGDAATRLDSLAFGDGAAKSRKALAYAVSQSA